MSFSIFLIATNGSQTVAGQRNDVFYNFDWNSSPLSDCTEYEVTFTFVSFGTATTTNDIFYIETDWGGSNNCFDVKNNNGAASTNILGFVKASTISTPGNPINGQYSSDINENVPVRYFKKPDKNYFNIKLIDANGDLFQFGNISYSLNIFFRTVNTMSCMD